MERRGRGDERRGKEGREEEREGERRGKRCEERREVKVKERERGFGKSGDGEAGVWKGNVGTETEKTSSL